MVLDYETLKGCIFVAIKLVKKVLCRRVDISFLILDHECVTLEDDGSIYNRQVVLVENTIEVFLVAEEFVGASRQRNCGLLFNPMFNFNVFLFGEEVFIQALTKLLRNILLYV